MRNPPSNSDDQIDSRDVVERTDELTEERQALVDAVSEATDELSKADEETTPETKAELEEAVTTAESELSDWDEENGEELKALTALTEEAEGYAEDWRHGAQLIRESYFTEYCQELLQDIGDLPKDLPSYLVIDWDATAHNLKMDYTEVEFDGVTYLVR